MNSSGDVFLDSTFPLATKTDFFPEFVSQRANVHEMQDSFFFLVAIGANGWSMEVSLPQIIPGEDFVLTKQPNKSGNLRP